MKLLHRLQAKIEDIAFAMGTDIPFPKSTLNPFRVLEDWAYRTNNLYNISAFFAPLLRRVEDAVVDIDFTPPKNPFSGLGEIIEDTSFGLLVRLDNVFAKGT